MRADDSAPIALPDEAGLSSLKDRAFLLLLLVVGAGAVAAGLLLLLTTGAASAGAIFDAVIGFAILLVSWAFVGPTLAPEWFHDRPAPEGSAVAPGGSPSRGPVPWTASRGPMTTSRASSVRPVPNRAANAPQIPRWADPMVAPAAVSADPGTSGVALAAPRPPTRLPRDVGDSAPLPAGDPLADLAEVLRRDRTPPANRTSSASNPTADVLREIDEISEELQVRRSIPSSEGLSGSPGRLRTTRSGTGPGEVAVDDPFDLI